MAKGFWIVSIDVKDAEGYAEYVKLVRPYLERCNATFLTRGGALEVKEGHFRSRNIIIEFASYEYARECYNSDEYQAMIALRTGASTADFMIVEGL